ncbi:MAG: NAD(P)/FAD-dependent oxidoreductase [Dehalococcoidia bacterium]|nr:NAD(P)/FAD-dependent oxidoreductase [Dehalococcoidia bacterium]
MNKFDIVIVGGGTAGEHAAGTALGLKKSVAIIDKNPIGGDCIFHACIPTKALVHAARYYRRLGAASFFGLPSVESRVNYAEVKAYKDRVVAPIASGRDKRWRDKGATIISGNARFISPNTLDVDGQRVSWENLIICTGSYPAIPPIPGLEETGCITNVEALELERLPERLAVIGGGPIGMELGQVFAAFGSQVTTYEALDHLLPLEDAEISETFQSLCTQQGIEVRTSVKVVQVQQVHGGKSVTVETQDGARTEAEHDEILVAAGRRPAIQTLDLDAAGINHTNKGIPTDSAQRTNVPNVWAAGDVTGGYLFTYVAGEQGKNAVLNAVEGNHLQIGYDLLPRATFCDPEVASVGLTEAQARSAGHEIVTGRFEYANLTRSILTGETEGFVKIVVDASNGTILGGHIIGLEASSLIHEVSAAMKAGLTAKDLGSTLHAYPTLSEAVRYACQAAA